MIVDNYEPRSSDSSRAHNISPPKLPSCPVIFGTVLNTARVLYVRGHRVSLVVERDSLLLSTAKVSLEFGYTRHRW